MRFSAVALFIACLAGLALGQSGRRFPGQPTPTPSSQGIAIEGPETGYSESRSRADRNAQYNDRFPGISNTPVQTQSASTIPQPATDGETLKIETNLITIPVSVFDRDGIYIRGLTQKDFAIFEDGQEQEIAYFATADKPVTVALLLDTSPSTQYRINEIHQAAEAFVAKLGPEDSVIVIEFNSSVKVQTKATKDREKIRKAIYKAKFGEGTSLYNGVDEAIRKQLGKVTGRKAVVLFTDGVDTTSRKNSYDGTISYAEESDTLVFPIYYNTYVENRARNQQSGGWGGVFDPQITVGVTAEEYALGRRYLDDLADATGGRVFRPESTPGGLTAAFEGIAEELRRQYNVGYIPKEEGRVGQRKHIKVRVYRPKVNVRARDSYVVGTSLAPPPATEPRKSN